MSKASITLFTEDDDVLNQVRLASESHYKVTKHAEPNTQLLLDDDYVGSPVVIYDLDNADIEKAKLDILTIKRDAPAKAVILVGDKETINTFINGDFEFLVFRVFAKPLRAKQMQLLLNSAFGTINDRTVDSSIAETLSVIERIESKNNSPLLKSYKLFGALASIVLLAILYFIFSPSNVEELNTPSQVNQTDPIPANSILDVDGSISSGSSLLIVGSLSSDPNPIEDAEDEALLAELDALESQAGREAQQSTRSSAPATRETTSAAPARAAAPPRPTRATPARTPAPVAPRPAPVAQSRPSAPQAVQEEPVELERSVDNSSELASSASNQQASTDSTRAATTLPSISPPVLISKVNPSYPRSAFARGVEGWVDVNISIDENGEVTDVEVIDSEPGRVFVRAVRRAIVNWKYSPAINNATQVPVESVVQELRISFRLDG